MQIVLLDRTPLEHICSFWSTHLMNFATSEAMYSLFPCSSLGLKRMIILSMWSSGEIRAYDKYVLRGYSRGSVDDMSGLAELKYRRNVVDEHTRRVCFPGSSLEIDGKFLDVLLYFSVRGVSVVEEVVSSSSDSELD